MRPRSYFCFNHQNKGLAYANALETHGFQKAHAGNATIIMSDNDIPGRVQDLRANIGRGISKFFVYPHTARPNLIWDLPGMPPFSETKCAFVSAEGHIRVLRAFGYDRPVINAGWSLCPLSSEFKPSKDLRRVLFAPIHPNPNRWLSQVDKETNKATYDRLYALHQAGKIELTIRHVGELENQGLASADNVLQTIEVTPEISWDSLDYYDLVVSHQTYAYISIARGKPTIMMNEHIAPHNGKNDDTLTYVQHWDAYKELVMYPLDILAVEDYYGLMKAACKSDDKITEWKSRMIGNKEFDDHLVVRTVSSYL